MSRGPVFDTPFTRITEHWFTHQANRYCAIFEEDFYRCASRVGLRASETICAKEFEDFQECVKQRKQYRRYDDLQKIRRDKKLPYEKKPEDDSYTAPRKF